MKAELICYFCGAFIADTTTFDGQPDYGICPSCLRLHFARLRARLMATDRRRPPSPRSVDRWQDDDPSPTGHHGGHNHGTA